MTPSLKRELKGRILDQSFENQIYLFNYVIYEISPIPTLEVDLFFIITTFYISFMNPLLYEKSIFY